MINPGLRAATFCATAALALLVVPVAHGQPENPLVPLVDAAAQRLQVAEPVAASKLLTGGLIEDPAREQQVLDSVAADATDRQIDPAYVTSAFRDQIDATVAIEYTRLAQWKFDPASAPVQAPDLASSRATIDGLNRTMVTEMAAEWAVLHSSTCPADLDAAKTAVTEARSLDPVYRQAIDFATRHYCR
ncbi:chorismate mutase [Mycolicibacterium vanbaalenii]|uniref:chorismate mutase n=1 Tax=Mycolicibacterium vanbaalenii TaxID=110539 RepID=UPI00133038C6|nr:chorismate mutase [Mycolicibacterium vanbaalenii]